jgi:L-alanine-DL-glutamate epimerase-like enolase superfamily enzyme
MKTRLTIEQESWPIAGAFTISRGSKTQADVITVTLARDGVCGRGECVPYRRYGESLESVRAQIETAREAVGSGIDQFELQEVMEPGAARNAVDCALWDLQAKSEGKPISDLLHTDSRMTGPVTTAVTVSLAAPQEMAEATRKLARSPLIKVKLGGEGDAERIAAVCAAAPRARIILDANEAWRPDNVSELMLVAARHGVALIEQPLPAGEDEILREIPHPVPVCADESAHTHSDLWRLRELYDCINIKLDKTGGLTAGLTMQAVARSLGFSVMVGCMVGTSLSMAPAVLLAQDAEYADLDGPLILARDRPHGLRYSGGKVFPAARELWG